MSGHVMRSLNNITAPENCSLICFKPNPVAKVRLFCFPYAGGNATIFRDWAAHLPPMVELWASQPPEWGRRANRAPLTRMSQVIEGLAAGFHHFVDKPFLFFGHSLGAVVAFELAQWLVREMRLEPAHLIVSGHGAPQIPRTDPPIHDLPDDEFVQELRRLKGTRSEILEHAELMQMIMPILRADFEISDTYVCSSRAAMSCAVTALGGLQDTEVTPESIREWVEVTTGPFSMKMLPGDHFFLHSAQATVLRLVTNALYAVLGKLQSS